MTGAFASDKIAEDDLEAGLYDNARVEMWQTDFSGRAEVGLIGDEDLVFKVSPDGTNWFEAIRVDKDSGQVQLPQALISSGSGRQSVSHLPARIDRSESRQADPQPRLVGRQRSERIERSQRELLLRLQHQWLRGTGRHREVRSVAAVPEQSQAEQLRLRQRCARLPACAQGRHGRSVLHVRGPAGRVAHGV